jgi:hypothetical protein
MLDMEDRLVEQLGDVRIVQPVKHVLAASLANHETEMAQLTQLVRNRRGLHPDSISELTDRAGPILQPPKDLHPTGGRKDPHPLRHHPRRLRINAARARLPRYAVTHPTK